MVKISKIIENQKVIAELLVQKGFKSPMFFKGFSSTEKNNLNLHLENDQQSKNNDIPKIYRRTELKDALKSLLGCEVVITVDNEMVPFFRKKLDLSNAAVKTSIEELQSDTTEFQEKMLSLFGEDWTFNISKATFHINESKYFDSDPLKSTSNKQHLKDKTSIVDNKSELSSSLNNTRMILQRS